MTTFDVRDFGATANDATDDSGAIQDAIDAAYAAGGGTVYIPSGTFMISGDPANPSAGCIEVRSNVTLTGDGMGQTILKLVDGFDQRINGMVRTPVNEDTSNVVISNLTIDGNRANNLGHQAGIITGVKENEDGRIHQDITISGVEVMNCTAYGVNPHEITYNLVVEDCVSHGNGLDGFVADYVEGGIYRNNEAYDNDRHGFNVTTSSNNVVLENNSSHDNGSTGIVVQRSNIFPEGGDDIPWVTQVTITGGEYYSNAREGILIKLSDSVTVTGVEVHDNMRQGIRVEGATNTNIYDSTIYNNSQEANGVYDEINIRLRVDDAVSPPRTYFSEDTSVLNNVIYADGAIRSRYGIREESTNSTADNPSGTVVNGNEVYGTLSGDYFIPPYSATEGPDLFYGTTSADTMAGLGGHDVYVVNHSGDVVIEAANAGTDSVLASLNHTLSANVEYLWLTGTAIRGTGNNLNNSITGNDVNNELEGLEGNDYLNGLLGADKMQGGDGNDTYIVDNVGDQIIEFDHLGAGGYDTVFSSVSYVLAAEVEELRLEGTEDLNATGNGLANKLVGNSGDNVIDGGLGGDMMTGGDGNDTYYIDHTSDVVVELANQGTDTVFSSLTYTLGSNVENLTLTGTLNRDGTGNGLGNVIIGNAGANILHGMDGDDTLEGGLGLDRLYGDVGNDTFVLRKGEFAGDIIEDFTGNGSATGDTIYFTGFSAAAVLVDLGAGNWMVQDGSYQETFRIQAPVGTAAVHFRDYAFEGVAPVNTAPVASVTGNTASGTAGTTIFGLLPAATDAEGDDIQYALVGSASNLVLNADGSFAFTPATAAGGEFTFSYKVVDSLGAESAPQVFTIAVAPQPAGMNVTGTNDANTLYGGGGNDRIDGLLGNDTMYGYGGSDTYYANSSGDRVIEAIGEGVDRVIARSSFTIESGSEVEILQAAGTANVILTGNEFANSIYGNGSANILTGNGGDDILDGKAGKDTLTGGTGLDTFVFSTALGTDNVDIIKDFNVVDDTISLSSAIFTALSAGQLLQDEFVVGTQALDASDHVIYDKVAGLLLYDADGAGGASAVAFANIGKNLQIDYLDFIVTDELGA